MNSDSPESSSNWPTPWSTSSTSIDFLQTLTERCVELLDADAAGLMLADQRGHLRLIASPTSRRGCWSCSSCSTPRGRAWTASPPAQVTNVDLDEAREPVAAASLRRPWRRLRRHRACRMRLREAGDRRRRTSFTERPGPLGDDDSAIAQAMADVATIGLLQERTPSRPCSVRAAAGRPEQPDPDRAGQGRARRRAGVGVFDASTRMRSFARNNGLSLISVASASLTARSTPGSSSPPDRDLPPADVREAVAQLVCISLRHSATCAWWCSSPDSTSRYRPGVGAAARGREAVRRRRPGRADAIPHEDPERAVLSCFGSSFSTTILRLADETRRSPHPRRGRRGVRRRSGGVRRYLLGGSPGDPARWVLDGSGAIPAAWLMSCRRRRRRPGVPARPARRRTAAEHRRTCRRATPVIPSGDGDTRRR